MFNNAKDLFKWLAAEELSKEELLNMLTEDMCVELIVKNNAAYLEPNGDKYDYRYGGEVVGTFTASKIAPERLETLLYNALTYIEDQGIPGVVFKPELGISDDEYNAIVVDGYAEEVENAAFSYYVSFDCVLNSEKKEFEIESVGREEKPDEQWTADKIRLHLSALCHNDELLKAIDSIDNIELLVERNGEYFDRDEADEETVVRIIALAKAPLLKPSLEKQVQKADVQKKQSANEEKVAVKDDLTL